MWTRRIAIGVLGGLALVASASCGASASFRSTGAPPHPVTARAPESVAVLSALPPAGTVVEIGRIDASSGTHTPLGDGKLEVLGQLQRIAGENGCDSILVSDTEESLFATSNGTPLYKTHQHAICLVNR